MTVLSSGRTAHGGVAAAAAAAGTEVSRADMNRRAPVRPVPVGLRGVLGRGQHRAVCAKGGRVVAGTEARSQGGRCWSAGRFLPTSRPAALRPRCRPVPPRRGRALSEPGRGRRGPAGGRAGCRARGGARPAAGGGGGALSARGTGRRPAPPSPVPPRRYALSSPEACACGGRGAGQSVVTRRLVPGVHGCPCAPVTQAWLSHAAVPGCVRKGQHSPAGANPALPARNVQLVRLVFVAFSGSW